MISSTRKASAVRNGEENVLQAILDLLAQFVRIVGRRKLGAIGGSQAALDRQRAPVA